MPGSKRGISVQVDAALHAEVKEYMEAHGMTMGDFVSLALQNELHPKQMEGENLVEKQRTIAFAVPESLFQKIKAYLQRNNLTQKQFFLSLIEAELEREEQMLTTAASEEEGLEDPETLDESEAPAEEAVSSPVSGFEAEVEEPVQEATEIADLGPVADEFDGEVEDEDEALNDPEAPTEEAVSGPVSASAENMEEVYQEGTETAEFEPVAADLEEETDHTGEDDALDEDEDESETEDPSFSMGM